MDSLVKMLLKILMINLIIAIYGGVSPLIVNASSVSSQCPAVSIAPIAGVYEMLPKYYDPLVPNEPPVLNETRECIHNFTKRNENQDIEPSITVLTHGLGGDPSHWSNDNVNQNIGYDSESIIEKMRGLDSKNTSIYIINNNLINEPKDSFNIEYLAFNSLSNSYLHQEIDLSSHELNKKVVILFQSSDFMQHNITDYHELDYIIDFFSYKYYLDYHHVPKINLIGHSRGGLTNIQYVNEHPNNVDTFFSIDTPYFGSEFGQMPLLMNFPHFANTINSCGGQDILDTGLDIIDPNACTVPLAAIDSGSGTLHQTYLDGFETAKLMNNQIKAYAIGSAITFDGILHVLARMMIDYVLAGNQTVYAELQDNQDFIEAIDLAIIALDVVNFIVSPESLFSLTLTVVDLVADFVNDNFPEFSNQLNQSIDTVPYLSILNNISSSISLIFDNNIEVLNPFMGSEPVLEDDIFIHLDSQLGVNGSNDYGFTKAVKLYNSHDSDLLLGKKSLVSEPAIPHNLAARDPDIIDYIMNHLEYDTYQFEPASSSAKKLVQTNARFESIRVPSKDSDGHAVTSIGEMAFANNTHVTDIHLPSTITSIHEKAFLSLPNLQSITVDSDNSVYTSVDGMLINKVTNTLVHFPARKESPSSGLTIPYGVTTIGRYAFKDNDTISVVYLNQVETIQSNAFENSSVTAINGNGTLTKVESDGC